MDCSTWSDDDLRWMERALALARRGEGRTAPNPQVGAVLVNEGQIVGEGFHARAGEPHAEIVALRQAGDRAHTIQVAAKHFEETTRTKPSWPGGYYMLGRCQSELDQSTEAFELDAEEISGAAAIRTALSLAGAALEADQKTRWYRKAMHIAAQLARLFPSVEYDLMAGQAALGAGDFEAAERWFRTALSKDEIDPVTSYFLGRSLSGLGRDSEAYDAFSAALGAAPDSDLARRIHGRMGQIAACRLDLETASGHYRSARQADRAQEIESLATQFAGALAQLKKLRITVHEIQQMERQLAELGDTQGVTAMQERAAAERIKITEIEDNLEAVRTALCR